MPDDDVYVGGEVGWVRRIEYDTSHLARVQESRSRQSKLARVAQSEIIRWLGATGRINVEETDLPLLVERIHGVACSERLTVSRSQVAATVTS